MPDKNEISSANEPGLIWCFPYMTFTVGAFLLLNDIVISLFIIPFAVHMGSEATVLVMFILVVFIPLYLLLVAFGLVAMIIDLLRLHERFSKRVPQTEDKEKGFKRFLAILALPNLIVLALFFYVANIYPMICNVPFIPQWIRAFH